MDRFVINGGARLKGKIRIDGAKNAALPIMAAALLSDGPNVIHGVPDLADVRFMGEVLGDVGARVTRDPNGDLHLSVDDEADSHAKYDRVRKMRASVCVLGPLLAKRKRARVSLPGGCQIGPRPIDLHLRGLKALGAEIELDGGDIIATCKKLRGAHIFLGGPFGSTVLGTANVMMAATLAEGRTVIESAACEPEVEDLADYLNAMGARISGAGTPRLTIDGVDKLRGAEHHVIPDRIEAGTFLVAAAITNGELTLQNCRLEHLMAVVDRLQNIGVQIDQEGGDVVVSSSRRLEPTDVTTQPFPGFPTDLQAQLMTLLCLADGNSVITEKIYPDRFMHVAELMRMGANIRREGPTAVVTGVKRLIGAPVMASDLRASAALVLAGLVARGATVIQRVYHIDRGYEAIEAKLASVGADITRVSD
ncbi:MAG: UDP-N-acetylglucosamine 1-carboxyvinyltransferase [Planctomycetes bacterium ADurb.Bin126]|nr:MAG: UDP-N-acetylglucosamine 1-carboxyvinyltransferase [Planctomycetes bacterium ADurb.Bin126]HOD84543.1 UDP-N-acetylglucosamine 1-carboxyvinyltransferase [Phycisphaerae bacterium]HQL74200.1 UDP-N-acetylglucosamine 1-carboxyvinyltransferase [Phycisphaerae bacterium]